MDPKDFLPPPPWKGPPVPRGLLPQRDLEALLPSVVIDWSEIEKSPKAYCECKCGASFASHTKFVGPPINWLVSKTPCPSCGLRTNLRRARSEPEPFTLRG